jgi:hypothetical protein
MDTGEVASTPFREPLGALETVAPGAVLTPGAEAPDIVGATKVAGVLKLAALVAVLGVTVAPSTGLPLLSRQTGTDPVLSTVAPVIILPLLSTHERPALGAGEVPGVPTAGDEAPGVVSSGVEEGEMIAPGVVARVLGPEALTPGLLELG